MKYIFICKNKMIDLLKRLFVYKNYEYIFNKFLCLCSVLLNIFFFFESIYLYMLCIIYYE